MRYLCRGRRVLGPAVYAEVLEMIGNEEYEKAAARLASEGIYVRGMDFSSLMRAADTRHSCWYDLTELIEQLGEGESIVTCPLCHNHVRVQKE